MANAQTVRDVLATSVVRSLVSILRTDLATAWGTVEVKQTNPDFDYDRQATTAGTTVKRDLAVTGPFVGVHEVGHSSQPWQIRSAENSDERTFILSILLLAPNNTDIVEFHGTVHSALQGLSGGSGLYPLLDPATLTATGYTARVEATVSGGVFGPGDDVQRSGGDLVGHAQFDNLKHRARIAATVIVTKTRGSRVA